MAINTQINTSSTNISNFPASLNYDGASVKAEKMFLFFFSTVFPKTAEKKNLNFFSPPFFHFPKQQKKKIIFFFSTVFPKTAEKKI